VSAERRSGLPQVLQALLGFRLASEHSREQKTAFVLGGLMNGFPQNAQGSSSACRFSVAEQA